MIFVVVEGANAGAQTELDDGSYRVGSGLDCDIVLSVSMPAEHAFTVQLDGERRTLLIVADDVRIQTKRGRKTYHAGSRVQIETPMAIQVGECRMALLTSAEETLQDQSAGLTAVDWRKGAKWAAGGAGIAACIAAIWFFTKPAATVDPLIVATSTISELGLASSVLVDQETAGQVLVRGIVESDRDRSEVIDSFRALPIDVKLVSTDEINRAVSEVTTEGAGSLVWSQMEFDAVRLTGVVSDAKQRDEIRRSLRLRLPSLSRIDFRVETFSEIAQIANSRLGEVGLSEQIAAKPMPDAVMLEGDLGLEQRAAFIEFTEWFDQEYGRQVPLANQINAVASMDPLSAIQAVYFEPAPEIVVTGGQRVGIGEILLDGWVVEELNSDRIRLRRDGEQRVLNF